MPRLRAPGSSIVNYVTGQLRSKASNSISAVQDTFFYTKVTVKNLFFFFYSEA